MTIRKTRNSSIALKPLYALGFALILMGCSNSETDTEHHDDHHHTEHEPSKTHSGKTLKTPDDKTTDDNHSTIRSAESHVHGGAKLAIVSEGNNVTIEFETPIYNLLGLNVLSKPQLLKLNYLMTTRMRTVTMRRMMKIIMSMTMSTKRLAHTKTSF